MKIEVMTANVMIKTKTDKIYGNRIKTENEIMT